MRGGGRASGETSPTPDAWTALLPRCCHAAAPNGLGRRRDPSSWRSNNPAGSQRCGGGGLTLGVDLLAVAGVVLARRRHRQRPAAGSDRELEWTVRERYRAGVRRRGRRTKAI